MKAVVFESEKWEQATLLRLCGEAEVVFVEEPLNTSNADQFSDAEIISTFIHSRLGRDVLEQMPRLRFIATRSTGVDHIDRAYCQDRGILVSHVPTYGATTVAEHVFGLILTISHQLWTTIDRTRKGDFSLPDLSGFDLEGKTLGIIGTGLIGQKVIRIARGFAMTVIACDVNPRPELAEQLGFVYCSLDDVLAGSDIISLHVPSIPATRHMISHEQFARMKDGVVLINTARGDVVDARALVEALGTGKVAAVGLDVLPEEPTIREEAELLRSVFRKEHDLETLLADHLLLRLRNVYITPHSAFHTREAVQRILDTTVENITAFCQDRPINLAWPAASVAASGAGDADR